MDVGEISSNKDLYEKVYIRDITKWFFCAKKIPLGYHMIKLDFFEQWYLVLCENKEKFWVLSKIYDDKLQIYKV